MARGVVVVGSGLIARFHAQAVKASAKLELKGFCDTFSMEGAQRAAAEFGGQAWGDLDSAFSSEGVGMVTVATASGAHDEAVFAAARHGLPVLSEKPLSITVARIDAMIAACREAGVQLGCIVQTRFSPLFEEAKVTLVVAAHRHRYRFDPADATRSWPQIVGGGADERREKGQYPTVLEGKVENGRLTVAVHDVLRDTVVATHAFAPRH